MCLVCCRLTIAAGYGMSKNRQKAKRSLFMILIDVNSLKLYHKEGRNATVECGETAAYFLSSMIYLRLRILSGCRMNVLIKDMALDKTGRMRQRKFLLNSNGNFENALCDIVLSGILW